MIFLAIIVVRTLDEARPTIAPLATVPSVPVPAHASLPWSNGPAQQRLQELILERDEKIRTLGREHPAIEKLDSQINVLQNSLYNARRSVGERRMPFDYLQAMRAFAGDAHKAEREALEAEYDAQLAALESDVKSAETEVETAKRDSERKQQLLKAKAIETHKVDDAHDRLRQAEAALEKAQSQAKLFGSARESIFAPGSRTEASSARYINLGVVKESRDDEHVVISLETPGSVTLGETLFIFRPETSVPPGQNRRIGKVEVTEIAEDAVTARVVESVRILSGGEYIDDKPKSGDSVSRESPLRE
jgi:hypothetical protein